MVNPKRVQRAVEKRQHKDWFEFALSLWNDCEALRAKIERLEAEKRRLNEMASCGCVVWKDK